MPETTELLPLYEDMLNGACCIYCTEPLFEDDGRTPKNTNSLSLCIKCRGPLTPKQQTAIKLLQKRLDILENTGYLDMVKIEPVNTEKPASAFISLTPKFTRGMIPLNRRIRILCRDNYNCQLCGKDLHNVEPPGRVFDHKVPVSKGGNRNSKNLWVLCANCDKHKGNKIIPKVRSELLAKGGQGMLRRGVSIDSLVVDNAPKLETTIPPFIRCINNSGMRNYCTVGKSYKTFGNIGYVAYGPIFKLYPEQFEIISQEEYEADNPTLIKISHGKQPTYRGGALR